MLDEIKRAAQRTLNVVSDRMLTAPLVVLMPHGACNARCVMCDIWKANAEARSLSEAHVAALLPDFRALGTERVVLSGGEALMHPNLFTLAKLLTDQGIKLTLLSTGLTLEKHAREVAAAMDTVTVSLDGSRALHDRIRNVPRAYDKLAAGVSALRAASSTVRITGRCVIQRLNFRDLPQVIDAAHELGLDQISFLPADVSSQAFNRLTVWDETRSADVALAKDELDELSRVVEATIAHKTADLVSGYVAESPRKLRQIVGYYRAVHGLGAFPEVSCNAPWVSAVIEADGEVRPCFFHKGYGNIHQQGLSQILNAPQAVAFRRGLDVHKDPTCVRCVCSLQIGPRSAL